MVDTFELAISSNQSRQVIDITDQVNAKLKLTNKLCVVFSAHTTCAVTTADLDPGTDLDLLDAVWQMIPKLKYRHPHNPAHVPAHLASSIIGPGVSLPVENGQLVLGSWQRVILVELDGPRERKLIVTTI